MITTVTMNASIDKAYFMDHTIENGTVMRVARCRNSAGGKGLNVARAIKLCGEKVQATGITGGFNGQYLESMLARDGIAYHIISDIWKEKRDAVSIFWMKDMVLRSIWSQDQRFRQKKRQGL